MKYQLATLLTFTLSCGAPTPSPPPSDDAGHVSGDVVHDADPAPTASECELINDRTSCLDAGCANWDESVLWLDEGEGKCRRIGAGPSCWMTESGEGETSELVSVYRRTRDDGLEEFAVMNNHGELAGWTFCDVDCPCPPVGDP